MRLAKDTDLCTPVLEHIRRVARELEQEDEYEEERRSGAGLTSSGTNALKRRRSGCVRGIRDDGRSSSDLVSGRGVGGEDDGVTVAGITSHVCGPKKERPRRKDDGDAGGEAPARRWGRNGKRRGRSAEK